MEAPQSDEVSCLKKMFSLSENAAIKYLLIFLPLLCYKISTANLGERWAVESRGSDPRSGNDREESVGFRLGINKVGLGWGQGWSLDNVGDRYQGSRIW